MGMNKQKISLLSRKVKHSIRVSLGLVPLLVVKIRKITWKKTRKLLGSTPSFILHKSKTACRHTFHHSKRVARFSFYHAKRGAKFAHHHIAVRPHEHLRKKWHWYDRWHSWDKSQHVHYAILSVYVIVVGAILINAYQITHALSDLSNTWTFSDTAPYTLDSELESSGSSLRLKAQNYTSDVNTMALFHLDQSSGTSITDSSSNSNTGTASSAPTWDTAKLNNGATLNGSNQNITVNDSSSLSLTGSNTLESWVKFGSSFSAGSMPYRQGIIDKGKYQLYYDNETGKVTYELENTAGMDWSQQAGGDLLNANGADIKRSWDTNGKQNVTKQVKMGSDIYVALGGSSNDAEVWKYSTGTGIWTQIAGDGINSSWTNQVTANAYESVTALATDGTSYLYAGLGNNSGTDSEVWRFNGTSWAKIGGDSTNSSWSSAGGYEAVTALAVNGSTVWAGLGNNTAGDAEVWRCTSCNTSPDWGGARIGGDGVNSSWANTTYELVASMTTIGGNPVVGLGLTAGDGEVWQCTTNCSSGTPVWTKRGGDGTASGGQSWASAFEYVTGLASDGNILYVGTGNTTNTDAEVWRCDISSSCSATAGWTRIASNATWTGGTHDQVWDITANGTTIYVGLGNTTNEDEVWRCTSCSTSPTWTKVGGDGVNSGWNATHTQVQSVLVDGTTVYAGLSNASQAYVWKCTSCDTSPTWGSTRIGGQYINKSWGQTGFQSVEASTTAGGKLYIGTGNSTAGNATVWEYDASNDYWVMIGGQGINSGWAADTYESVTSMVSYKNQLYVGIGTSATDAELWRWGGTTWTKVGGDGTGSSWNTSYETVNSLSVANNKLYAGIGNSAGDGEVWECTSCDGGSPSWTQIGGTASGNWGTASYTTVSSMTTYKGTIYAGLGNNAAGLAEVWRYSGSSTTWTKVGGDAVNSSWANSVYEDVPSLAVYNDKLVAGLGNTGTYPNSDAEVWSCTSCDGGSPTWTKIGGDSNDPPADNLGWLDSVGYEKVLSMVVYNGDLYASLGTSAGDGEVYKYNGTTWTAVGGDGVGWTNNIIENVGTMAVYRGKLWVGTGITANSDAMVWSYGDNGYLQSAATTQDTNWHHIAARYNGTTMEILIDGVSSATTTKTVTMPDTSNPLKIGSNLGSTIAGSDQGFASVSLDEIRISNTNRSSVTTLPYSSSPQKVTLTNAVRTSGVSSWDDFTTSETTNGGTIAYRLSIDDGTTWKYWNGSDWASSSSTSEANAASVLALHMSTLPVNFSGIIWQAVLTGDGTQQVTLNNIVLSATSDTSAPGTNASSITALKAAGGSSLAQNDWTNGSSPYFSWTAGDDSESGILGYCLYLGTDNTADPITTKGLLGTSPVSTGSHCQFIVSATNIDLATAGYMGSALTTSNSPYYLTVKAIDKAGNVTSGSTQFYFRFDNTPPTNPAYITAPSGFINTKEATFSWPTVGGSAPSDANSGIAGLQYKIGSTSWYGDDHTGAGDINDLLTNDGSYTTLNTPDYDNIEEGINTVEFRTWDQAGNISSSNVPAALKINTSGAPSEPTNLAATPSTSSSNSFSFSWTQPVTFVGNANTLNYCYTVNTLPSEITCSYTGAGITSLASGPYATLPGANTLYLVAKDESGNINYANYASTVFTANTTAPGIPRNIDIVDVSIKSTSSWRLALTWDVPADVGGGVSNYRVYRSTDNTSFSFVGSSTSTTYIDAGLSQQTYYYYIRACDSTNNCGAAGTTVSALPTGKFTTPATMISEPVTSNVTTKKATISWTTDRGSDSKIALGTESGEYSPSEVGNSSQVNVHTINLDNLSAGTTYYFVAKWTDEDGNLGTSQEYTFTTSPAPTLKEVSAVRIGLTSATIQFTSKDATKVAVYYGKSEAFGGLKTINTSISESTYNIELEGLDDGTKQFYQLASYDNEGNVYEGSISSFTTPPRPRIANLRFQPVPGEPTSTQEVSWDTNVASSSLVSYGKSGDTTESQVSELVTAHKIVIRGLEDDSEYTLIAQSRDKDGNLAVSDRQVFHTALDTRPPKISNITVESTIRGVGAEARGQAVVSWKTDEPSTSQVAYAEGAGAVVFNSRTAEDSALSTEHVVIVSDLPTSRVYSLQPISKDKASNTAAGDVQSAIIGRASDSVLTIILNTLKKVFGF